MRAPIALSKTKLLSLAQCRRKLWLETYNPELVAEPSAEKTALLATGNVVGEIARRLYGRGGGHIVSFERGLRAAIDSTRALIAAGGREPIFEATFDHDGVNVRIDVLDRSESQPKLIEVKSAAHVKEHYLDDCAVQAWALAENGLTPRQVAIATIDTEFVYPGNGAYEGLLVETDVTEAVRERLSDVRNWVGDARRTLADLDEPEVLVGVHCGAPHGCEFYAIARRLRRSTRCSAWVAAKRNCSSSCTRVTAICAKCRKRSLRTTRSGSSGGSRGSSKRTSAPSCASSRGRWTIPRYYLDFETVAPAVPIFAGTRPFETLPFQWSCHVETSRGAVAHAEFLDLGAEPPMRRLAEGLLATLGTTGPIVVYTPYERRVIDELAARYPDLAAPLVALTARIVDLHPPTRRNYYHPAMQGSWSIKAVLPTVAPDLHYDSLGEVRNGFAAQTAYFEAIDPRTSATRRATLRKALLDYCRQDTLALVRLVEFFAPGLD